MQDMIDNQECRLGRIVHCETKSGSRDELLLVYARHPSGKDAIVLADRNTSFDPSILPKNRDGRACARH